MNSEIKEKGKTDFQLFFFWNFAAKKLKQQQRGAMFSIKRKKSSRRNSLGVF
jgi:hypothetical protein